MTKERIILSPNTRRLLDFVKAGRLGDLEDWVKNGNSLRISELKAELSILSASVRSGFYSLIEFVLRNGEWAADELACALDLALADRRTDLADLLIGAGAPVREIQFDEACRTINGRLSTTIHFGPQTLAER